MAQAEAEVTIQEHFSGVTVAICFPTTSSNQRKLAT